MRSFDPSKMKPKESPRKLSRALWWSKVYAASLMRWLVLSLMVVAWMVADQVAAVVGVRRHHQHVGGHELAFCTMV